MEIRKQDFLSLLVPLLGILVLSLCTYCGCWWQHIGNTDLLEDGSLEPTLKYTSQHGK